jgi:hypothetical protein
MRTKTTIETYEHLCSMLNKHTKVYYSRFGDGDFYIMNGRREKMHRHSPELAQELTEAFLIEDPLYLKGAMVNYPLEEGMRSGLFAPPSDNSMIQYWLVNNQKILPSTTFDSHIMFHYISVFQQDKMLHFLDTYIRPRTKMFIGSVPKEAIERLVGPIDFYVNVPERDAYYTINDWYPSILENIDKVDVCLPAAGMAGRVIQKRLWKLNKNIHSIDLGSVIDAACNVSSRTWIDIVERGTASHKISNLLL